MTDRTSTPPGGVTDRPQPHPPLRMRDLKRVDTTIRVLIDPGSARYGDAYNPDVRLPVTRTRDGNYRVHATSLPDHVDAIPNGYTPAMYYLLVLHRIADALPGRIQITGADNL